MEFLGQPVDIPVFVTEEMAQDVPTHGQGHGYDIWPAVNVKVHLWVDDAVKAVRRGEALYPSEYTEAFLTWAEGLEYDHVALRGLEEIARKMGWADAEELGPELFEECEDVGTVKIESAGRSGGWLLIKGIDEPRDWVGGGDFCHQCDYRLPDHYEDCGATGPYRGRCDRFGAYQVFAAWAEQRAKDCLGHLLELVWLNQWDHHNDRPLHDDEELIDA